MKVIKRNGKKEEVKFDKVVSRIKALAKDLTVVEPTLIAQKVVTGIHDNITTQQIDSLLSTTAAVMGSVHPDYLKLAVRVEVSSLHKETDDFYQTMKALFKAGYLSESFIEDIKTIGQEAIEKIIDYERDYTFDYFGFKTLEKSYLLKLNKKPVERPQHMFMRVAIGICGTNLEEVKELYDAMSLSYYTHATPTLFNAGTKRPQMSSCFLVAMEEDSIEGIYNTLKEAALISKSAGGVGLHIHNIRSSGSPIFGTNGNSNGLIPMLKVFESTMKYVDQGGGKRKGSCAVYLEPWHKDVEDFLRLNHPLTPQDRRADECIFTALWIPDLFMQRVEADADWTLFCPTEAEGLADCWGEQFNKLYTSYEEQGFGKKVRARHIWELMLASQSMSGRPYVLFKDACNSKSNQQNLGTIKSSNLCTEIIEYSDKDETAVCNLASMSLPKFVKMNGSRYFDYEEFYHYTKIAVKNLNRVIDRNYYPTEKTRRSNVRHRPISLGLQGLSDLFMMFGFPFGSKEAAELNRNISACMYYAAAEASMELSKIEGPYETFSGSPASQGKLQPHLWGIEPLSEIGDLKLDWKKLTANIVKHGLRNSLLIGLMPTASTSQIFGNFESFDPPHSNMFVRETLAGDFVVINKHLVNTLMERNLWTQDVRSSIINAGGSVQNIEAIPKDVQQVFMTATEISQRSVIDLSIARAHYVCQAQSLNLNFATPNFAAMSSAMMYAWKNGSKNGVYYMRTKPAMQAQKVNTAVNTIKTSSGVIKPVVTNEEAIACSLENPEACEVCSS